jgi:preprotein translocase subunit SecE
MQFLEYFKIGGSWITSGIVYALMAVCVVVIIRNYVLISRFTGEVKSELRKASWPWESDPKIKGFRKYKELTDSTIVVLIAVLLLAGFVQFWDFLIVLIVSFFTSFGR